MILGMTANGALVIHPVQRQHVIQRLIIYSKIGLGPGSTKTSFIGTTGRLVRLAGQWTFRLTVDTTTPISLSIDEPVATLGTNNSRPAFG